MVTYRWLSNKILKPQEERIRAKAQKEVQEEAKARGLAQGIAQGLEQGLAQELEQGIAQGQKEGREQVQHRWEDWFRRREEAERKGEPFDEPPPTL